MRPFSGDDNADDARIAANGRFDHLRAIYSGHQKVGDDDIERELFEEFQRFFAGFRLGHFEAALSKTLDIYGPKRRFVVDKEQVAQGIDHLRRQYFDTAASGTNQAMRMGQVQKCPGVLTGS